MPDYDTWIVGDCNTVTFDAPAYAVFDLVTQARFWPEWHVSSHGIAGVTQRPYRVGDIVYEFGQLDDGTEHHLVWRCVEQDYGRDSLLVEETLGVGLRYRLVEDDAGHTTFTRGTLYHPDSAHDATARALIAEASAASVLGIHRHVGRLLARERDSLRQAPEAAAAALYRRGA
ncbi:SRPBCC family protein [Nocardia sp. alder85J]|uniref:SRPBCC family protein n=1 Tax=Nocardia sp. alder85J TaxID=2862949 RepID=UPI001CD6DF50|nr:SRPBCC family protein [Nocardia sp. alder85J]MCX4095927.1 SRPBCC family protein [Nocardia sp. alder85J]